MSFSVINQISVSNSRRCGFAGTVYSRWPQVQVSCRVTGDSGGFRVATAQNGELLAGELRPAAPLRWGSGNESCCQRRQPPNPNFFFLHSLVRRPPAPLRTCAQLIITYSAL